MLGLFGLSFGVATASRDVLFPLLLAEVFGTRYFAQIYGFFMLAYFPGGGLGPIALGHLHDVTGSYAIGFAGVGAWYFWHHCRGIYQARMPRARA